MVGQGDGVVKKAGKVVGWLEGGKWCCRSDVSRSRSDVLRSRSRSDISLGADCRPGAVERSGLELSCPREGSLGGAFGCLLSGPPEMRAGGSVKGCITSVD